MQVHNNINQRRIPSSAFLSSANAVPASPTRPRATTVNASAAKPSENQRITSARSSRSLRDMSVTPTNPPPTLSSASGPSSGGGSGALAPGRSRTGSSARFLSVNTQAASSSSTSTHGNVHHPPRSSQSQAQTQMSSSSGPSAGSNTLSTPDSLDGGSATVQQQQQNGSGSSSSPASVVASSAVGSPSPTTTTTNGPAHGLGQRDRGLTRKSSSRTIGGTSVLSVGSAATGAGNANANAPRKTSSAATQRPAGSTKDGHQRAREKPSNKALGRSRLENKDATDEDDVEARSLRLLLHNAEPAPPTLMYWSRAPIWGVPPTHKMRSHSATVVDNNMIWMFGGCDDKEFWRDVLCLDVETMECTRPTTCGDVPPPCRAHTATLVDRRLFIFGGGQGNVYYNSLYILDTALRKWTHVSFNNSVAEPSSTTTHGHGHGHGHTISGGTDSPSESIDQALSNAPTPNTTTNPSVLDDSLPRPRRAHTTVLYKNRLVVFGGGNGAQALNDVWVLDISVPPDRMKWVRQRTTGAKPSPRGYHTANLVGNVMVVVGGSDGRQTFADIFCLNLDTWHWSMVHADRLYRRLAHTATQIGSYLFIMGGHDGSQYTNELLLFNLVSLQYEPRSIRGIPPSPRGYHAAALADGRLWVFGGFDGRAAHDDMYMLDLASSAYLSQVTGFQINVD